MTAEDVPNALMERLSTQEAQLLASVAAGASAPVLRPDVCVGALKRLRLERELAELQREIDRLQTAGNTGAASRNLLQRKLAVQRAFEAMGQVTELQ